MEQAGQNPDEKAYASNWEQREVLERNRLMRIINHGLTLNDNPDYEININYHQNEHNEREQYLAIESHDLVIREEAIKNLSHDEYIDHKIHIIFEQNADRMSEAKQPILELGKDIARLTAGSNMTASNLDYILTLKDVVDNAHTLRYASSTFYTSGHTSIDVSTLFLRMNRSKDNMAGARAIIRTQQDTLSSLYTLTVFSDSEPHVTSVKRTYAPIKDIDNSTLKNPHPTENQESIENVGNIIWKIAHLQKQIDTPTVEELEYLERLLRFLARKESS